MALIHSFIIEGRIVNLQIENSTVIRPDDGISSKTRQLSEVTKRQTILGPLNSAGEISNNAVDDCSTPLRNEAVLRSCPKELLLPRATRSVNGCEEGEEYCETC